jgi:hypothetical protein
LSFAGEPLDGTDQISAKRCLILWTLKHFEKARDNQ